MFRDRQPIRTQGSKTVNQSEHGIYIFVIVGGAEVGWYVTVIVKGVPRFEGNDILVLTSLLPHEHR